MDDAEDVPGAAAGLEAAAAAGAGAGAGAEVEYMELHGGLEIEGGGSVATEVSHPG